MKRAAFLVLAAAWLTGEASAHGRNDCCPRECRNPCDSFAHRLRDRLHGLFQRDCCNPCPAPAPKACPDACGHRHRICHRERCRPVCHTACRPAPTCCERERLIDRLRGLFHRDRCCDPCAMAAPGGKIETTPTPGKKLPAGGGKTSTEPPSGEVRIAPPTIAPSAPSIHTIPATPAIEPRPF